MLIFTSHLLSPACEAGLPNSTAGRLGGEWGIWTGFVFVSGAGS
jgi:hypothetical protein